MSKIHVSFPISSVCFPIALATSHFDTRKNIQVAIVLWNIELVFESALNSKTCSTLTVGCSVSNALSLFLSSTLSRFFSNLFTTHVQKPSLLPKWFKRFQYRQAVVQQSKRENLVAYLLLIWSAVHLRPGARSRLVHNRFLLSKHHVSAFFSFYRLCVYPCVGIMSCSLLSCLSARLLNVAE